MAGQLGISKLDFFQSWQALIQPLHDLGLKVERGEDFDLLDAKSEVAGLPPCERQFSPSLHTFTPAQAFWLCVVDGQGMMVARVCARFDDLGGMCLTDFWRKHWKRCYPRADGLGQAGLAPDQPRFGQEIFGRVAYLGSLFVAKDYRKSEQGFSLGGQLTRLALMDALDEWGPDFLYSWIEVKTGRSLWEACRFTRRHPHGIRWQPTGTGAGANPVKIDPSLVFAGLTSTDLADQIDDLASGRDVQSSGETETVPQLWSEKAG